MIPDPIIVAGCPRSGTSLTMGVLNICGAWVGPYAKNPDNPKGTFENLDVLSLLIRRWKKDNLPYEDLERRLRRQGYAGGPWAFKLTGAMLDYFGYAHEMWPGARWIIVRRDVDSIIASHRARGQANRLEHINRAHMALKQVGAYHDIASTEMWPQRIVGGDVDSLKDAVTFAGLLWNEAVREFVEPGLWHYGPKST